MTVELESGGVPLADLTKLLVSLSQATSLGEATARVKAGVRRLLAADGVTIVLRDGDQCHYFDEDAIAPLWQGHRFPMSACISGWSMETEEVAVIEDIYADSRIPHSLYRPTFVKSLVMVPVRLPRPIAAIGVYWSFRHRPSIAEINVLQIIASAMAMALNGMGEGNDATTLAVEMRALRLDLQSVKSQMDQQFGLIDQNRLLSDDLHEARAGRSAAERRDIAAQRSQIAAQKRQANAELQRDDAYRRRDNAEAEIVKVERRQADQMAFLAAASHDLKQPIQALELFLTVLAQRHPEDGDSKLIGNIQHILTNLGALVRSLMDVAKLEQGIVQPSLQTFSLNLVLEDIEAEIAPFARKCGVAVHFQPHNQDVRSDPVLLGRIVRNLVSNAIKYTPAGGTVEVFAEPMAGKTALHIRDTGVGIPAEKLETVFEPFRRLRHPMADGEGSGLGLAIVRRLADLLGHVVSVQSQSGVGSTFTVGIW